MCRDELTLTFVEKVEKLWGETFSSSSLGGMLFLGKTGFLAAQHHSPNEDGRERHVYFALPHIGVGAQGEIGRHDRPGRLQPSHACGALHGFQKELENRSVSFGIEPDDLEQSLLKQHLFRKITYGDIPDLVSLTKIAYVVILEELERMIHLTVDPLQSDYAVRARSQRPHHLSEHLLRNPGPARSHMECTEFRPRKTRSRAAVADVGLQE